MDNIRTMPNRVSITFPTGFKTSLDFGENSSLFVEGTKDLVTKIDLVTRGGLYPAGICIEQALGASAIRGGKPMGIIAWTDIKFAAPAGIDSEDIPGYVRTRHELVIKAIEDSYRTRGILPKVLKTYLKLWNYT